MRSGSANSQTSNISTAFRRSSRGRGVEEEEEDPGTEVERLPPRVTFQQASPVPRQSTGSSQQGSVSSAAGSIAVSDARWRDAGTSSPERALDASTSVV